MCSIFGSFKKEIFKDLHKLNSYRGELTYSISIFTSDSYLKNMNQGSGKLSYSLLEETELCQGEYLLGHTQAPTGEDSTIHPAEYKNWKLWHNGIVKEGGYPEGRWDTEWILENIYKKGWDFLSDVDGSFSCVLHNPKNYSLFLFRNEISPLFVDEKMNISSTRFDNSYSLPPNNVFRVNLTKLTLVSVAEFKTKENPYFF